MTIDSDDKGKRGEREWAIFCRDHGFLEVRRGVQYNGLEGEDCVNLPGVHQEVKRDEQINIDKAMAQAVRDAAPGTIPVVAHRKNAERSPDRAARFYRGWKVTMRGEDFLAMIANLCANVVGCPVLRGDDARRFHEDMQRPPAISEAARQLIRDASRLASEEGRP